MFFKKQPFYFNHKRNNLECWASERVCWLAWHSGAAGAQTAVAERNIGAWGNPRCGAGCTSAVAGAGTGVAGQTVAGGMVAEVT